MTGFTGGLAVAAGDSHSLALKNDGFVWAWGSNSMGQFGVASPASSTVPVVGPFIGLPPPPSLSVSKTHTGNFTRGQIGATYSIVVSDGASAGPTTAAVTVTETIPAGLTLTGMTGTGWICSSNTCTRSDTLNGGGQLSSHNCYGECGGQCSVARNESSRRFRRRIGDR